METKNGKRSQASREWSALGLPAVVLLAWANVPLYAQQGTTKRFEATGPTEPVRQDRAEFGERKKPSVTVTFDSLPASMRFHLPAFPCMVTENNIRYSNFWDVTYSKTRVRGDWQKRSRMGQAHREAQ